MDGVKEKVNEWDWKLGMDEKKKIRNWKLGMLKMKRQGDGDFMYVWMIKNYCIKKSGMH